MRVKFLSNALVAENDRRETIIDMINKGETERTANGEEYSLRYRRDGKIRIYITGDYHGNIPLSWTTNIAWIVKERNKVKGAKK
jgi:hypothetical protein